MQNGIHGSAEVGLPSSAAAGLRPTPSSKDLNPEVSTFGHTAFLESVYIPQSSDLTQNSEITWDESSLCNSGKGENQCLGVIPRRGGAQFKGMREYREVSL